MGAEWTLNSSTVEQSKRATIAAIGEGMTEVFAQMVADAKQFSPVRTGFNRDSIDSTVEAVQGGIRAQMYTASGYGGILEVGGKKKLNPKTGKKAQARKGRFYMYGAFRKFAGRLGEVIGQKVRNRSAVLVKSPGK